MKQSDKRRGMAAQKAEAQRRLFRPAKRTESDMTPYDKKRRSIEKRKQELKEKLAQVSISYVPVALEQLCNLKLEINDIQCFTLHMFWLDVRVQVSIDYCWVYYVRKGLMTLDLF